LVSRRHSSPLFPYTTLFRSQASQDLDAVAKRPPGLHLSWLKYSTPALNEHALLPPRVDHRIQRNSKTGDHSDCQLHIHEHVGPRSEEHTSELQSQSNLVCRL